MENSKKIKTLQVVPFLAVLFLFAAGFFLYWGGRDKDSPSQEFVVGISMCDTTSPWNVAVFQDILDNLNKENISVQWKSAQSSMGRQIKDVQELMEGSPEYLLVMPVKSIGLEKVLTQAADMGIKIILLGGEVSGIQEQDVFLKIHENAQLQGELCAWLLAQKLGEGEKRILELQCENGSSSTKDRSTGFRKELCKYDNLELECVLRGSYKRMDSYNEVISYLIDGSRQVDAIFAHNDEAGMGALAALETLDQTKDIPIISVGGIQDVKKAMESGEYYACVDVDPYIGEQITKQIRRDQMGMDTERQLSLGIKGYTNEDIEQMQGY